MSADLHTRIAAMPLPEPVDGGSMYCEDCGGSGTDGDPRYQSEFQPPEYYPCRSCEGSGRWKASLFTEDQMRDARHAAAELALAHEAAGEPVAPSQPRLIGWRTADYLMETADKKRAENWAQNIGVLPIFDGDTNTKLVASPVSPDPAVNAEMLAALKDLLYEVACAGLSDAKDFGWPDAVANARAAIASAEAAAKGVA